MCPLGKLAKQEVDQRGISLEQSPFLAEKTADTLFLTIALFLDEISSLVEAISLKIYFWNLLLAGSLILLQKNAYRTAADICSTAFMFLF